MIRRQSRFRFALPALLLATGCIEILAPGLDLRIVLGQWDFVSNRNIEAGKGLAWPSGVHVREDRLFVADADNSRILIWNSLPVANRAPADVALGQPDLSSGFTNYGGVGASTLYWPESVFSDGARLFVADTSNNRVLIWNSIPAATGAPADLVLGQPDFVSNTANNGGVSAQSLRSPRGVWSDGTRLAVADASNNRVLIWNSIPAANQAPADVVLGQPNFTIATVNSGGLGAGSLYRPWRVFSDGTRLFVVDAYNHRVLIWNSIPVANQTPADLVLGQPNFTVNTPNNGGVSAQSLYYPRGIWSDATRLVVVDYYNSRVLIWNSMPAANQAPADLVLGQPDFSSNTYNNGGVTASSLNSPMEASSDGTRLFVTDYWNSRVLAWNSFPTTNQVPADLVLGQPDMASEMANNPVTSRATLNGPHVSVSTGRGLAVAEVDSNRVLLWPSVPRTSRVPASFVLGQQDTTSALPNNGGVSARSLYGPYGLACDGVRLFVSDTYNHRILIWNAIPAANQVPADVVLGQPDFASNVANNGGVSAQSIYYVTGIGCDGTRLFAADADNHRVLIWNSIPTANQTPADVVLGQPDFASNIANNGGVGAQSLNGPLCVFSDGTRLFVSDTYNNRVLVWNSIPTANGAPADLVLGQPDFASNTANNGGLGAQSLYYPRGVFIRGARLYLADTRNHRVLIWEPVPATNGAPASRVLGQPDMTSNLPANGGRSENTLAYPSDVWVDGDRIWVADWGNNRVITFPSAP